MHTITGYFPDKSNKMTLFPVEVKRIVKQTFIKMELTVMFESPNFVSGTKNNTFLYIFFISDTEHPRIIQISTTGMK